MLQLSDKIITSTSCMTICQICFLYAWAHENCTPDKMSIDSMGGKGRGGGGGSQKWSLLLVVQSLKTHHFIEL